VVVLVPGLSPLQRERAGCVTIAINVGVCPGRESGDRPTPKVTQFARIVYEDKSDTNYAFWRIITNQRTEWGSSSPMLM
jgi:hypothetical protein